MPGLPQKVRLLILEAVGGAYIRLLFIMELNRRGRFEFGRTDELLLEGPAPCPRDQTGKAKEQGHPPRTHRTFPFFSRDWNCLSSRAVTPKALAFSYFGPGSSPTTT